MFLSPLRRRNPEFLRAAAGLHASGSIPANSYVIDLDAVTANAQVMAQAAAGLGLTVFAMTKQMGRNPHFCRAVMAGGIDASVAVDMQCARATLAAGMRLGHLGHLVQVPGHEAAEAAAMDPAFWTVFSPDKAAQAAAASQAAGRVQDVLLRIHAPGDTFYLGHQGGFEADDVVAAADFVDGLDGARCAGITTFPALLFSAAEDRVEPTHNLATLASAAAALAATGRQVQVNAPGTTSSAMFGPLAAAGATQVEPGHGLTGTTPLHARHDELPELPAVCYVTEVSHEYGGRAYCFGGGMYIDPVFPDYQVQALVVPGGDYDDAFLAEAELPPPSMIDYYGMLTPPDGRRIRTGDTVVFGFRIQAFVTRAFVVPVQGARDGTPQALGVWASDGRPALWPGQSLVPEPVPSAARR
jgi:predicted amino acid racemase